MEELTFHDLEVPRLDLTPVEFLGKRAYIKKLTFGDQQRIEDMGEETEGDQLLNLLALSLCNGRGELYFASVDQAREVLKGHSAQDVFDIFASLQADNGLDQEAEIKN